MKQRPMNYDKEKGWIAVNHYAFIGWEILRVVELRPGEVLVSIRRRVTVKHWIPPSQRTTRDVLSSPIYVPISMWQARPFGIWRLDDKDPTP